MFFKLQLFLGPNSSIPFQNSSSPFQKRGSLKHVSILKEEKIKTINMKRVNLSTCPPRMTEATKLEKKSDTDPGKK